MSFDTPRAVSHEVSTMLEQCVDAMTLHEVLSLLAAVCFDRAEENRSHQLAPDPDTAAAWERAGSHIDMLSENVRQEGI